MKRLFTGSLVAAALALAAGLSAFADSSGAAVGFGTLFFNGGTIRTIVTPSAFPNSGTDPFFKVTNGAAGQRAGRADRCGCWPGDRDARACCRFPLPRPAIAVPREIDDDQLNLGTGTSTLLIR